MRGEDDDSTMLLSDLRCDLAQGSVIRLVEQLEPPRELLDRQRRAQKRRPVCPGAPDDTARRNVARFRMARHSRRVDVVGTTVEIDDVSRHA